MALMQSVKREGCCVAVVLCCIIAGLPRGYAGRGIVLRADTTLVPNAPAVDEPDPKFDLPEARVVRKDLRPSVSNVGVQLDTARYFPKAEGESRLANRGARSLDTTFDIMDVRIVGRRTKEIIAPQRLEGIELKRLNTLSVADALRFFSGVQIKDYGGIGGLKTINIRSMGSEHVGVYYDGLQLGNAQNGQVDLGKFSMDNVEIISLYNGQKSEIFQGAKDFGAAGTVYIETRRPRFEKGKNTNFRVGAKVGSFGLMNLSALVEHKLSRRVSASVNAEWTHAHGHYKFRYKRRNIDWTIAYDTTAIRQNSDVNAIRAEGGVYGALPGGNWKIRVYHYSSERGLPGAIVNNVWRRGERMWDRNTFIQGYVRSDATKWYRIQASVKYAYDFLHYINKDQRMLQVDNTYRQQEAYGSVANLFSPFEWWDLSLSYDFQWNTLVNRNEASDMPMYDFPFPTRYSNYLSAATAFEKWGVKLQASILGVYVLNRVKQYFQPADRLDWTPAVFLSYMPWESLGLSVRAFWKHSLRMPTFNDLYYTEIGNTRLEPEYVQQYDAGIDWRKEWRAGVVRRATLTCDVYYNEVTNKIIAYPKGQQFRWTMINLGFVKVKGIDAIGELAVVPWDVLTLMGKLQYTFQDSRDWTNPRDAFYGHQIPYIAWHSGSAIFGTSWREWSLNYSFIYVGERFNQQENIIYNYTQPWYTHDLSLAWDGKIKSTGLRVTLEVCNLLGQDYDVILNYPMPKTNFRISVNATF